MKTFKETLFLAALSIAFFGCIAFMFLWDFHLWRLEHPFTAAWVYFARGGQ